MAGDAGRDEGAGLDNFDYLLWGKVWKDDHQVGVGVVVEVEVGVFVEKKADIARRHPKREDRPVDAPLVKGDDIVHPFYFVDEISSRHHQKSAFFFVDDGHQAAKVFFFDIAGADLVEVGLFYNEAFVTPYVLEKIFPPTFEKVDPGGELDFFLVIVVDDLTENRF